MTITAHPRANELLALGLGEMDEAARRPIEAHANTCEACRAQLTRLADLVSTLSAWEDEEPPARGFERLLDAVGRSQMARPNGDRGLGPLLSGLAAVLAGGLVIHLAGARLAALPYLAQLPLLEPLRALFGLGIAAVVFFGIGSFVTLALSPMLILDLRPRRSEAGSGA